MLIGSILQIYPFDFKPSAPAVGAFLFYMKGTTLYLQDSSGTEYPFGSTGFISSLTGDVTTTGAGAAVATVQFVGGQSAANVALATIAYLAATSANTASTLVKRDASGNFAAGTITANLIGNASTATFATTAGSTGTFTGTFSGDVTGGQSSTVVATVGGKTAADIASAVGIVDAATSSNIASTLVERDASGNFAANQITAATFIGNLTGNVTGNVSGSALSFTGPLIGDVTGTQGATVVSTVGGQTAAAVAAAAVAVAAATNTNTASTLVKRDASGNFAAGTISAALIGNVTGNVSGTASNITGLLAIANGGTNSAAALANNRIMISAGGAIVESAALTGHRALISNASGLPAVSVTTDTELAFVSGVTSSIQTQLNAILGSAITSLTGDGTATGPGAAVFTLNNSAVTGQPVTGFVAGPNSAVTATDTILQALQKLQAQVSGTGGTAITQLTGDVTAIGPGSVAATVAFVGGQTAAAVAAAAVAVAAATTAATANTLVLRDGTGKILASNFSGSSSGTNTGDVTETDTNSIAIVLTGQNIQANLKLSTDAADAGNLKMTSTIHGGVGAAQGLHVEVPFGTPVNIGTTNSTGSDTAVALRDHVHAITFGVIGGLIMSTYVIGTNVAIAATDSIVGAFGKLQAQINAIVGAAITSLTGDVTATGPGAAAATISVGAVTDTKASLSNKPAVSVVATTNQTLSGAPTIDGQATTAGTSIALLTAQTTASDNGPWVVQSGAWTRPTWFPNGGTTQAFQFITTLVRLGTIYQGSTWRMTTSGAVTIGTTATAWAVTPLSGNFKSTFVIGPQTGSAAVSLNFANANVGTLAWNPGANQTITLPPNLVGAGTYLSDTGSGVLAWTNPLVNIDGGTANSNYTSGQIINGGTA